MKDELKTFGTKYCGESKVAVPSLAWQQQQAVWQQQVVMDDPESVKSFFIFVTGTLFGVLVARCATSRTKRNVL
jgi:hypothetical protein